MPRWIPLALLTSTAAIAFAATQAGTTVEIGRFSNASPGGELPGAWRRYALGKPEHLTEYKLVEQDGKTVLRADAVASVSAVIHPLHADPNHTPWLAWSWRVDNLLQKSDILTQEGDDYPARVYVLFDYDPARLPLAERAKIRMARMLYGEPIPVAALCYVWDGKRPSGFSTWSAYTSRLRMIVVESGAAHLKQWVSVERNVAEDYRRAFGEDPPTINAVIIASDTDNTRESARAYFGDVTLRSGPVQAR
jgi:hypothetical protein